MHKSMPRNVARVRPRLEMTRVGPRVEMTRVRPRVEMTRVGPRVEMTRVVGRQVRVLTDAHALCQRKLDAVIAGQTM